MHDKHDVRSLSDAELLRRLSSLVGQSRRVEADVVAHIAEFDQRRLYAREAAPSMFAYCTEVLHLSEQQAYLRIAVARASRRHPMLLPMLRDGRLHLSGVARLAPHLTAENRDSVLKRATHRSKRQIDELVAELQPRPEAQPTIRRLPERRPRTAAEPGPASVVSGPQPQSSGTDGHAPELCPDRVVAAPEPPPPPLRPARVEPLAASRYKVQFTASAALKEKLSRLQALMRRAVPDCDLGAIIEAAVTEKLERLEAKRFGRTRSPRKGLAEADTAPTSRDIPAPVRRAVYERDGGRCTYVSPDGRRCSERDDLEFHHEEPYGRLGDHSVRNIRLACRAHNALWAEQDYGLEVMGRYRRGGGSVSELTVAYSARSRERVALSRIAVEVSLPQAARPASDAARRVASAPWRF